MTDKEIIKALGDRMYCGKWIGKGFLDKKDFQILKNALALINRQQAEIEDLKEDNFIKSQKRANIFEILNAHEKGRAEAIKEFAERLKIAYIDTPMDYYEIEKTMMSIVKEMVGEGK